jgi:hypothetical protein
MKRNKNGYGYGYYTLWSNEDGSTSTLPSEFIINNDIGNLPWTTTIEPIPAS